MTSVQGRLGVGIIGMGRVGPVIGAALRAAGHTIVAVNAHSDDARERAEAVLPGVPLGSVNEVLERCEVIILAIPDEQIEPLVSGLADLGRWQMGQIVIHLAGPYGTSILARAQAAGAIPLAIHPSMAFTGWSLDVHRLTGAPFVITAPAPFLPIAQALVVEMGGEPVVVGEEQRAVCHSALTLGVNAMMAGVVTAAGALEAAGIDSPGTIMAALLHMTLDRVLDEGVRAIEPPVAGIDAAAVKTHMSALVDAGEEEAARAYARATRDLVHILAAQGRLAERGADAIEVALLDGENSAT